MSRWARRAAGAGALLAATGGTARRARAEEPPARITFQAGQVEADLPLREVALSHGVAVQAGRYRLHAPALRLGFRPGAVDFEGPGRVAFCPCPEPPVALGFSGGQVSEDGDLRVRWPRLLLFGTPVLAVPWLWLRTPARPGVLPPLVALRGDDGLLLGSGVHLPWVGGDGRRRALDVTGAGYVLGGAELGARYSAPDTTARATWDQIRGTRVAVEGRGAFHAADGADVAWSADAIRGGRARTGTTDLGAAALPYDAAAVETSARAATAGALLSTGAVARAARGEGAVAAGPFASAALGGALGRAGTWDAGASGLVLGGAAGGAMPLARAALGADFEARPGPFEVRLGARGRAQLAGETPPLGRSDEALGAGRIELGLPLARSFDADAAGAAGAADPRGAAPLVHRITPAIELRGAVGAREGPLLGALYGPLAPASAIAAAGVSSTLGRAGGAAVRLDAAAGGFWTSTTPGRPIAHARLGGGTDLLAASLEAGAAGAGGGSGAGAALIGRARVGRPEGLALRADLAGQAGDDPRAARAVADRSAAALPGGELAYLAGAGWTGGAELTVPWTRSVRTGARADVDLGARALLGVRGIASYRHPCGCLDLGLVAAHRQGRGGVDVAATIDLAPR